MISRVTYLHLIVIKTIDDQGTLINASKIQALFM